MVLMMKMTGVGPRTYLNIQIKKVMMTGRVIGVSLTHARAGEFSKTSQGHVLENTFFQKRTTNHQPGSLSLLDITAHTMGTRSPTVARPPTPLHRPLPLVVCLNR